MSVHGTACAVLRDVICHHSVPARDAVQRALDAPEATFRDARTAFARVIPLLAEDAYRAAMLPTLTRTIASRSESAALVDWLSDAEDAMVNAVYADLLALAQRHVRDNRVIVPVLQTVQHLLEWDILPENETILERLVHVATAYVATLKSVPRLTVSMHMYVYVSYAVPCKPCAPPVFGLVHSRVSGPF
ncbi:hypothetical protein MBRA1_001789 [Malassezia brasiliensis]|uniref:Tubulin-folding cofactor D C-terminal domain-containing protein n=1 Tax=Malassezia brasiliensis TaxID=1821822 RepID=A0AAF0DTH0_9BASI|nr:hypothetical protein MBRA1_001789 [Malassezia brasiliensis]